MIDEQPTKALAIRLATPDDIALIAELDRLSTSPTRDIHRDIEKYFGSVDPSTHEHTFIFLVEIKGRVAGKAELMIAPSPDTQAIGYIKRVVVDPDFRGRGIAQRLMQHIIQFARNDHHLKAIDLHVWEENSTAVHLYESLGFNLRHRELYYRLSLD